MGLRFASVRQTNVVVMAPALTDTSQTQNFKFSTSPSRSPSLSLRNHMLKKEILHEELQPKLSNGIIHKTGMNGHSPTKKTTYSINGLAKNLKNEFLPLNKRKGIPDEKGKTDCSYSITQIGGYMMNNSYMGDPEMGLQKSNKELCDGEKISPEVDQFIKNLSVVMNSDELSSNTELNDNVEEIFKAISNLDSNTNEIESGPSGDIENIFDNGLFNETDIMNMCVDESLVTGNKNTPAERLDDVRKKQIRVRRQCELLMRRLRKISTRQLGRHAAEEVAGVIEYSSNFLEASSRLRGYSSGDHNDSDIRFGIKPISPSSMSLFIRQMDHAVNQQTNSAARSISMKNCKYFGSGSSSTNNLVAPTNGVRSSQPGSVIPPFSKKAQRDMLMTSGEVKSQLEKMQQDYDSDATESSSGGESCDEFITYNNIHQQPLPINKRASWKWAEDRGLIAAKWIWLQVQLSELDNRIRLHNEAKRTIRLGKELIKSQDEQSSVSSLPNGHSSDKGEGNCSRTRGIATSSYRKRKLLQLNGLHNTNKKAAVSATLRCSCNSRLPGCALCTGRVNPGEPLDPIISFPVAQRVAYLDSGFHPVLSFPQDISPSVHYDAIMKVAEWQNKASNIQKTSVPVEDKPRNRSLIMNSENTIIDAQRSKAASLAVSVKIRRKLARGRRKRSSKLTAIDRYRHRRKHSTGLSGADSEETNDQDIDASGSSRYPSPVPSPASTQGIPVSKDKDLSIKRKRENSYDIDNIVIPYSMASTTRPEKLDYKEILTPKWRLVNTSESSTNNDVERVNGIIRRSSHENSEVGEEDDCDEVALARHDRFQLDERKKFLSYTKRGLTRGRAQRRTDSRADSSGPNTPDGMSPRDDGPIMDEPVITSPPQTPCDNETGRKRTLSSSQLPPLLPEVPPYEARKFPLSDEVFRKMVDVNNSSQHYPINNSSYQNSTAAPASPGSVSTDSADSFLGEDPNDPEWTTHGTVDRTNCKR